MGKKIISFSLYGKSPDYTLGAVANARHVNKAYPGWICRFYVSDDVPRNIISRLKDYDTEIINMGQYLRHEAKFWRFFAAVDPEVDIVLFRDSDSRFTKCELLMVNEWLASGKKFHVMRTGYYPRPVLAGLWGVRGNIPNWKEQPETIQMAIKTGTVRIGDEKFIHDNLYPQMKGNVFVHEFESLPEQVYFVNETIHPFPPIAKYKRGKYLDNDTVNVGLRMPSRRTFIVFSIYKRTIFSELFLTIWLSTMEKTDLFRYLDARFYVADNISPGLIERLRRHGRVILKSAKTVHKDDPQYWKLLILSEKNPGLAVIVDFWQVFFLARARESGGQMRLYEVPPMPPTSFDPDVLSGFRSGFSHITTLSVCFDPPISDIENLVERRNPNENYRVFINSTVYPRTSTVRIRLVNRHGQPEPLKGLTKVLFTPQLYRTVGDLKNRAVRSVKMLIFWKL